VLVPGCKPAQQVSTDTNTNTNINTNKDTKTETVYVTVAKDSVVIRDSVVVRPDGSTDRWHNQTNTRKNTEKIVIRIRERLVITNTKTITKQTTTTKYIEKPLKPWQKALINTGILSILLGIIFIIYKLKNKFKPL
jgi:CHAT domain-containing protein